MSCEGCSNPTGGLFINGCRTCSLRAIIASQPFWQSMRAGKLTPEYIALVGLFGEPADVHAEVRALEKEIHLGSCPA